MRDRQRIANVLGVGLGGVLLGLLVLAGVASSNGGTSVAISVTGAWVFDAYCYNRATGERKPVPLDMGPIVRKGAAIGMVEWDCADVLTDQGIAPGDLVISTLRGVVMGAYNTVSRSDGGPTLDGDMGGPMVTVTAGEAQRGFCMGVTSYGYAVIPGSAMTEGSFDCSQHIPLQEGMPFSAGVEVRAVDASPEPTPTPTPPGMY